MRPAPGPVYICDRSDQWETSLPAEAPRPASVGHGLVVQDPSNMPVAAGYRTLWALVDSWSWSGFRPSEKYRWACIAQMPVGLGGVGRYQAISSAWRDGKSPRTTVFCQGMRILLLASPLHFSRTRDGESLTRWLSFCLHRDDLDVSSKAPKPEPTIFMFGQEKGGFGWPLLYGWRV